MHRKLLVLGLDAADARTVGAHLARGRMPFLSELSLDGARVALPSTPMPITPSAWAAALTGKNPGKTGVLTFERRTRSYRTALVSGADLGSSTLLSILPQHSRATISIGFPMTSPPPPGCGVVVAGWDARPGSAACNDERFALVADEVGYRLEDEFSADAAVLEHHVRSAFHLAAAIAQSGPWDCLMLYLGFIDSLAHRFGAGNSLTQALLDAVDDELRQLVARLDCRPDVLVCSDHGFAVYPRAFSAIQWLVERGHAVLRSTTIRGSSGGALPGIEIMDLDAGLVDWSRTKAFCHEAVGSTFGIRLNVRGSYPAGIVEPGDAWTLAEEIRSQLLAQRDPADGSPLVRWVRRREELFWGPHVHEFPELVAHAADDTVAYVAKRRAVDGGFAIEPGFVHRGTFGGHADDGLWISSFPVDGAPRIEDVAPTVCALLGVAPPDDADGRNRARVAVDIAAPDSVSAPNSRDDSGEPPSPYTREEEAAVRQRLEGLGYL